MSGNIPGASFSMNIKVLPFQHRAQSSLQEGIMENWRGALFGSSELSWPDKGEAWVPAVYVQDRIVADGAWNTEILKCDLWCPKQFKGLYSVILAYFMRMWHSCWRIGFMCSADGTTLNQNILLTSDGKPFEILTLGHASFIYHYLCSDFRSWSLKWKHVST